MNVQEICAESEDEDEPPAQFRSFKELQRYLLRAPFEKIATAEYVRKRSMLELQTSTKEQIEAAISTFETRSATLDELVKESNEQMSVKIQELQQGLKDTTTLKSTVRTLEDQMNSSTSQIKTLTDHLHSAESMSLTNTEKLQSLFDELSEQVEDLDEKIDKENSNLKTLLNKELADFKAEQQKAAAAEADRPPLMKYPKASSKTITKPESKTSEMQSKLQ